mgnify:CR=1 FL=1
MVETNLPILYLREVVLLPHNEVRLEFNNDKDKNILESLKKRFLEIDDITEYNQLKVLKAFTSNGVSEATMAGSTGYGYDDRGREILERVMADCMGAEDAIISDSLNHASIIDGVRLCKAVRYRYANADMEELEDCLKRAQAQRFRIIVTDGVFSMDGNAAPLDEICRLAKEYRALVMVDECHSAGVLGATGRGITELYNLRGEVDILTGTLGKAFGGAIGGFTTGRKEIIDMLRQRSRPYLFSNTLAPAVTAGSIKVLDMLENDLSIREKLFNNTKLFATKIKEMY